MTIYILRAQICWYQSPTIMAYVELPVCQNTYSTASTKDCREKKPSREVFIKLSMSSSMTICHFSLEYVITVGHQDIFLGIHVNFYAVVAVNWWLIAVKFVRRQTGLDTNMFVKSSQLLKAKMFYAQKNLGRST